MTPSALRHRFLTKTTVIGVVGILAGLLGPRCAHLNPNVGVELVYLGALAVTGRDTAGKILILLEQIAAGAAEEEP